MASTTQLHVISLPSSSSSSFLFKCLSPHYMTRTVLTTTRRRTRRWGRVEVRALSRDPVSSLSQDDDYDAPKPTKLVTFLGKGGSGKTTTSIFAAQHYAMAGLKTCLVIHSQDPTVEYLLNCKIGTSPIVCCNNLVAVRLETTKMLLEPLDRLKQADAHLNITQGLLEVVVGEELGVLPGMDSIFSVLALGKFLGFYGNDAQRNSQRKKFDIIIYDGMSSDETLRLMGATSKARLYLKYLRNLAEKTDLGRLAGPSILRLVDETLSLRGKGSFLIGRTSSDIWDDLEQTLEKVSSILLEPRRFGCYLVMDLSNTPSLNSALRYWGCAIQAGIQVSGAFGIAAINSNDSSATPLKALLSPLPFAFVPHISMAAPVNWNKVMPDVLSENARNLLTMTMSKSSVIRSIKFDPTNNAVTLFMPGFDKSEIKLYQYRGGSELLVEAGDQRRVIRLPSQMQGRVGGAKFTDRNLIVTLR